MLHPFWAFFFQWAKKKPPFSAVSEENKKQGIWPCIISQKTGIIPGFLA
ncbi:hypothetical protein B4096_0747 [Heyndrickxia coagulans]|nr:hypothetical protein B4096_0747 [Heyndrickxia coagulans]